jgi:hypothetical protein
MIINVQHAQAGEQANIAIVEVQVCAIIFTT